jgi:hypothetical protein
MLIFDRLGLLMDNGLDKTSFLKIIKPEPETGRFDRLADGPVRTRTKTEPTGRFMTEPVGSVINQSVLS